MKKFLVLTLIILGISATVFAAPTCVMLKFANDTRYKNIDSAAVLSDLVMEKLLTSGEFNLVEMSPIDEDMETQLYNEESRYILATEKGLENGNFNDLFESGNFDKNNAQSIATAQVGQIILPEITSKIGKAHGAEYLIQGTIINMGNTWIDESTNTSEVYLRQKKSIIAIAADVKIINSETGEVVWRKVSIGDKSNALTQVGMFKFGTAKLNAEMYNTAMARCAEDIVNSLLKDLKENKVFVG